MWYKIPKDGFLLAHGSDYSTRSSLFLQMLNIRNICWACHSRSVAHNLVLDWAHMGLLHYHHSGVHENSLEFLENKSAQFWQPRFVVWNWCDLGPFIKSGVLITLPWEASSPNKVSKNCRVYICFSKQQTGYEFDFSPISYSFEHLQTKEFKYLLSFLVLTSIYISSCISQSFDMLKCCSSSV